MAPTVSTAAARREGGRRVAGTVKQYDPNKPVVTVATVTYNCVGNIQETIESVLAQSYPNIEYIVIDGGSTDGTLDIIQKHEEDIAYWVSEKDNGIYDAMNKAVRLAGGEWINYINAGDTFYKIDTVERVFENIQDDADVVYGNSYYKDHDRMTFNETYDLVDIWKSMIFCHQSSFIRTEILRKHPFSTHYKISSDYEVLYYCYVNRCKFLNTKQVIAVHNVDGVSEQKIVKRMIERWKIVRQYTPSWKVDRFYLVLLFRKALRVLKGRLAARVGRSGRHFRGTP